MDSDKSRFFSDEPPQAPHIDSFPYEYGSDLHWLWGWGQRIDCLLSEDKAMSAYAPWVFRPDSLARDAMMRFSVKYSHVIKQIDDYLDFVEKMYTDFSDDAYNGDAESATNLATAMYDLLGRIKTGADIIAQAERQASTKTEGDTKKGQRKKRPLNDRARGVLAAFNRKIDGGEHIALAKFCREFCEEEGDSDSVYRTLKDWPDLRHKPGSSSQNGDKTGTI